MAAATAKATRALSDFRVEGVATNIGFLGRLLDREDVAAGRAYTGWVEEHLPELADARSPTQDPTSDILAPVPGVVVAVDIAEGDEVTADRQAFVLEAMKMEHVVTAGTTGIVRKVAVRVGDMVADGALLACIEAADVSVTAADRAADADPDRIRPDLAEVNARRALGLDEARPDAVARRHATGHRTAREHIADLCDPDSFVEYGAFAIAAQRGRRPLQELIERTPADGWWPGSAR